MTSVMRAVLGVVMAMAVVVGVAAKPATFKGTVALVEAGAYR